MAQTTGKQNGTLTHLSIGAVDLTHETECSWEFNTETIDVTTKDSSGYKEILPGVRSITMSGSAFFADDATYGFIDLETLVTARTSAVVTYSTNNVGDHYVSITGYVTSLSRNAGVEGEHTYSVSFEATGAPTIGTEA